MLAEAGSTGGAPAQPKTIYTCRHAHGHEKEVTCQRSPVIHVAPDSILVLETRAKGVAQLEYFMPFLC